MSEYAADRYGFVNNTEQFWRKVLVRALASAHNDNERSLFETFYLKVLLLLDERKVQFRCYDRATYRDFMPYRFRLFNDIKCMQDQEHLSMTVEVAGFQMQQEMHKRMEEIKATNGELHADQPSKVLTSNAHNPENDLPLFAAVSDQELFQESSESGGAVPGQSQGQVASVNSVPQGVLPPGVQAATSLSSEDAGVFKQQVAQSMPQPQTIQFQPQHMPVVNPLFVPQANPALGGVAASGLILGQVSAQQPIIQASDGAQQLLVQPHVYPQGGYNQTMEQVGTPILDSKESSVSPTPGLPAAQSSGASATQLSPSTQLVDAQGRLQSQVQAVAFNQPAAQPLAQQSQEASLAQGSIVNQVETIAQPQGTQLPVPARPGQVLYTDPRLAPSAIVTSGAQGDVVYAQSALMQRPEQYPVPSSGAVLPGQLLPNASLVGTPGVNSVGVVQNPELNNIFLWNNQQCPELQPGQQMLPGQIGQSGQVANSNQVPSPFNGMAAQAQLYRSGVYNQFAHQPQLNGAFVPGMNPIVAGGYAGVNSAYLQQAQLTQAQPSQVQAQQAQTQAQVQAQQAQQTQPPKSQYAQAQIAQTQTTQSQLSPSELGSGVVAGMAPSEAAITVARMAPGASVLDATIVGTANATALGASSGLSLVVDAKIDGGSCSEAKTVSANAKATENEQSLAYSQSKVLSTSGKTNGLESATKSGNIFSGASLADLNDLSGPLAPMSYRYAKVRINYPVAKDGSEIAGAPLNSDLARLMTEAENAAHKSAQEREEYESGFNYATITPQGSVFSEGEQTKYDFGNISDQAEQRRYKTLVEGLASDNEPEIDEDVGGLDPWQRSKSILRPEECLVDINLPPELQVESLSKIYKKLCEKLQENRLRLSGCKEALRHAQKEKDRLSCITQIAELEAEITEFEQQLEQCRLQLKSAKDQMEESEKRLEQMPVNKAQALSGLSASEINGGMLQENEELIELHPHRPEPASKQDEYKRYQLNPCKTFANYVPAPENRSVLNTAQLIAANPGDNKYNPFYIYGGSGLGKTHLISAIANSLAENKPEVKVTYTRAEDFIFNYVVSIKQAQTQRQHQRQQRKNFSNNADPRDIYFNCMDSQVFIIDDVQNFSKAAKSRDAFFEIIAEFIDKPNCQLILASDVPPATLLEQGFNPRLTSRFGSGVCCEVQMPSIGPRRTIASAKCFETGIKLSETLIDYIANNIQTNVREIEGAVKTLNSQIANNGSISMREALRLLDAFIPHDKLNQQSIKGLTVDVIKRQVALEFSVTVADLESGSKKKIVTTARAMAMALAKQLIPGITLSDIGRVFNKDHSSVSDAIKRINKRISAEPELQSLYDHFVHEFQNFRQV